MCVSISCHFACICPLTSTFPCLSVSPLYYIDLFKIYGAWQRDATKTAESNLAQTAEAIKAAAQPAAATPHFSLSLALAIFLSHTHTRINCVSCRLVACGKYFVCLPLFKVHFEFSFFFFGYFYSFSSVFHSSRFFPVLRVLINFLSNFFGKCVRKMSAEKDFYHICICISFTCDHIICRALPKPGAMACVYPHPALPLFFEPPLLPALPAFNCPRSVAGILGLTCGMTMPRAKTNHSHNFKTISKCAALFLGTSSTSLPTSSTCTSLSFFLSISLSLSSSLFLPLF